MTRALARPFQNSKCVSSALRMAVSDWVYRSRSKLRCAMVRQSSVERAPAVAANLWSDLARLAQLPSLTAHMVQFPFVAQAQRKHSRVAGTH